MSTDKTSGDGRRVVVALGGNAILQPGQVGTFEEQLFNVDGAMRRIAALVEDGWHVVLTHGNGPQVGNLLIQNAVAAKTVAPMPMDVCGAMSQGQIGYMAAQTLANHLRKRRLDVPVVTLVTQVAVDPKDKAFARPSKPVGPFYSEAEARKMMLEDGLTMREDAGRGWRRVVPSPEPREIVELEVEPQHAPEFDQGLSGPREFFQSGTFIAGTIDAPGQIEQGCDCGRTVEIVVHGGVELIGCLLDH